MRLILFISSLLLLIAGGCKDNEDAHPCKTDTDCGSGRCLVAPVSKLLFCAQEYVGCASGLRWSDDAGDELRDTCVSVDAGIQVDAAVDGAS